MSNIKTHKDLRVFQYSFEAGMEIYKLTKSFPKEEMFSLTNQIRRSSRSVSGNLAKAWRKRRYEKAFVAKLSDCEGEAAETQVWLDYALACEYMSREKHELLYEKYNSILGMLVTMMNQPEKWKL